MLHRRRCVMLIVSHSHFLRGEADHHTMSKLTIVRPGKGDSLSFMERSAEEVLVHDLATVLLHGARLLVAGAILEGLAKSVTALGSLCRLTTISKTIRGDVFNFGCHSR